MNLKLCGDAGNTGGAMTVHQCDNEGMGPSSKLYGTSSPSALRHSTD